MALAISEMAILAAVVAFCITQVHLWRVAKKIMRRSEESWASARQLVSNTEQSVKKEVQTMREDVKVALTGFDEKLSGLEELEMPELDQEALVAAIGPVVSQHMEMAFHQVEAQQAKRVGAFLKDMDLEGQLGELEEGVRAQAMEALPAQAQVLMDVMNTKIPKSATITEKALLNVSKAVCAQLLQGGMASIAPQRGAVEQAAVSTGFGVRAR